MGDAHIVADRVVVLGGARQVGEHHREELRGRQCLVPVLAPFASNDCGTSGRVNRSCHYGTCYLSRRHCTCPGSNQPDVWSGSPHRSPWLYVLDVAVALSEYENGSGDPALGLGP